MTDEQIVRAVAEKVMGWTLDQAEVSIIGAGWNPLTSDADACAVLDKMATHKPHGWDVMIFASEGGTDVMAKFERCDPNMDSGRVDPLWWHELSPYTPENRRRVICIAALKAVGAYEEDRP